MCGFSYHIPALLLALRDYGVEGQIGLEATFSCGEHCGQCYMCRLLAVIAEIKRVLKPSGQFWINLGDVYGGTRWSGKGVGQPINKFRDGYRDINPKRSFKPSTQGERMYSNPEGLGKASNGSRCLSMMPERIALACIDELGFILRNRCVWAKQVLDMKIRRTKGSVMPSSVHNRFNESWEYLYFFVKNSKPLLWRNPITGEERTTKPNHKAGKEGIDWEWKTIKGKPVKRTLWKSYDYWCDLDAVRLPHQVVGVTDLRDPSILRQRMYPESKYNKFNYRVRDANRKKGQPQFRASKEEIKRYNEVPEDYGKKKLQGLEDKGKELNRWMSGTPNYVYQGKFAGNPDAEMFNSPRARTQRNKEAGLPATYIGPTGEDHNLLNNPLGKNLPTVHLVEEERNDFIPFSFEKQTAILGIKEFENLKNIFRVVENQLINSSAGVQTGSDISADNDSQSVSDTIQEFFSSRKIQPYLTLFRGSPYATIAIKNTPNEISVIFGRNVWIFSREGFTVSNAHIVEGEYKWFAFNCNSIIGRVLPLFNWMSGFQLGTDYIKQLNVSGSELKLGTLFSDITISDKESQEISRGRSNFAKVFLVKSILKMPVIVSGTITDKSFVMSQTKVASVVSSQADRTTSHNILNLTDYLEKGNRFPTVWLVQSEPHNFRRELGVSVDHFATFPQALVEIPIKFGCPPGGIVLDPFCGSGTTLLVAKRLGRNYIGIDLNEQYCEIARRRLSVEKD